MTTLAYPPAPRVDLVERYHGVRVADPFRPLDTAEDPGTVAWVEAENALSRAALDSPSRAVLVSRLQELHRVPRTSAPVLRGRRLFFTENDGTRNQAVLYALEGGASTGEPGTRRILVDPNALDTEGTTALTVFAPDDEGTRVVYGLSRHGSDVQELLVHDLASGVDRPDRLKWVKFASIAWWREGFFYTRYPQPGTVAPEDEQYFCQVWFHRIGDPQTSDRLVYHRPDEAEVAFEVAVTSDAHHLIITGRRGASDKSEIHVVDLASFDVPHDPAADAGNQMTTRALVTGFERAWHFIDGADAVLYFRTDAGAPFGRIVRVDLNAPGREPVDIVAETTDTLVDATIAGGHLLVSSLHHASSRLTRWTLDGGSSGEIALPGIGTIVGVAGRLHDPGVFVTFTSFTMPPTILSGDIEAGRLVPLVRAELPFDPAQYITEQVWYPSKDGTKISMFLVRNTGSPGLEPSRVLLTGYGGFNISLTPAFDASDFLWLDSGGQIAVANLRGGGEYGEAWHEAGVRDRKQNVFDDFIAAAEWLRSRVGSDCIAIEGSSNGGLLVGAVMVQRPDLFSAVVCRVPVADMLRYHLFTVGRFWIPEYGCADDVNDFPFLFEYSPYHNVTTGAAYPPTLIMTADTDDRVAPGMAKKFAARLQEAARADSGPILLRVEVRAGHGAGKPITKQIDEQADIYAFLFRYMTERQHVSSWDTPGRTVA